MDIKNNPSPITYRDSGVDIDAGNALIDAIKPHAKRTARKGRTADLGGFGGLFDLKNTGFNDPILVAATDGVGHFLEGQTVSPKRLFIDLNGNLKIGKSVQFHLRDARESKEVITSLCGDST